MTAFRMNSPQTRPNINNADGEKNLIAVFLKLIFLIVLLVVCPISTYFLSKLYLFEGEYTILLELCNHTSILHLLFYFKESEASPYYAVFTTVLVAHVILAGFVVVIWRDSKNTNIKMD